MNQESTTYLMPDRYHELVRKFPLICIHDEHHHRAACDVIDGLLVLELDSGGEAYLEVLTALVGDYEETHIEIPDASEADVLQELMDANRLTPAQLATETGMTQSTISAVLNGSRTLTKSQVVKLAERFHVAPQVFLPR